MYQVLNELVRKIGNVMYGVPSLPSYLQFQVSFLDEGIPETLDFSFLYQYATLGPSWFLEVGVLDQTMSVPSPMFQLSNG